MYPDVVGQTNRTDYGIFAIKYMEMWNGATLIESIAKVSSTLVYLHVFIIMI